MLYWLFDLLLVFPGLFGVNQIGPLLIRPLLEKCFMHKETLRYRKRSTDSTPLSI
jgi:hypothetical protein